MKSEKVKEIKKVLEEGQYNTIKHHPKVGEPILVSFADILTLINELESENERLKSTNTNILKGCEDYKNRHVKQFAERLRENFRKNNLESGIWFTNLSIVDETLKEFIKNE